MVNKLIASNPKSIDLTNTKQAELIEKNASKILKEYHDISEFNKLENHLINETIGDLINPLLFLKITKSSEFASFIENLTEDNFNKILNNIPLNITQREPFEFTDYDEVQVSDLTAYL